MEKAKHTGPGITALKMHTWLFAHPYIICLTGHAEDFTKLSTSDNQRRYYGLSSVTDVLELSLKGKSIWGGRFGVDNL